MKESILPFMNKRVLVLEQTTPAKVAARALHERHVGSAVVSDHHGHIVGLVTDRDLSTQVLGFELPNSTPISEIMTEEVLRVDRSASIGDVAKIMEVNGIRRIPIIEKTGGGRDKCVGMVSLDDLIASESLDTKILSRIVRSQILRRIQSVRPPSKDESHREQTFNRFNKLIAAKMGVPKNTADRVTFHILKDLVRCLPYTEAAHFIAQLPSLVHEDLLNLPAGPDLKINEKSIIEDLMKGFQLDRPTALDIARRFWAGLEEAMDPGILEHVLARIPKTIRELFTDRGVEVFTEGFIVAQESFQLEETR